MAGARREDHRPVYDGHFIHTGITYGVNEPTVADSGVTVNGIAISARH
jgi:hypothetical protein